MTGIHSEATARQTISVRRGVADTFDGVWEESDDGGETWSLVDLTGWSGVFQWRDLYTHEVWLEKPVVIDNPGYIAVTITPADTAAPIWATREGTSGDWLINLTPPLGLPVRHGDGLVYLEI